MDKLGTPKSKNGARKGMSMLRSGRGNTGTYIPMQKKQMSKVRNESFEMVMKTLQGIRCPDQVVCPFVEALKCLSEGKDITITERIGKKVASAIEDQRRIGQPLMLRGILSRKWQDAIAGYTKERVSRSGTPSQSHLETSVQTIVEPS